MTHPTKPPRRRDPRAISSDPPPADLVVAPRPRQGAVRGTGVTAATPSAAARRAVTPLVAQVPSVARAHRVGASAARTTPPRGSARGVVADVGPIEGPVIGRDRVNEEQDAGAGRILPLQERVAELEGALLRASAELERMRASRDEARAALERLLAEIRAERARLAQAIAALVEVAEHEAVLAVRRNDAVDTLREILLSTPSVPPVAVRAEAGSEANADGDARDHPHALSTPMGSPPRRAGAGDEG